MNSYQQQQRVRHTEYQIPGRRCKGKLSSGSTQMNTFNGRRNKQILTTVGGN